MKEEFQKALLDLFNKAVVAVEKGATFLNDQIPDVVQQYLSWVLWSSALWAFVFLVVIGAIVVLVVLMKPEDRRPITTKTPGANWRARQGYEDYNAWPEERVFAAMFGGVVGVVSFFLIVVQVMDIVKVLVAPKLVILEKIASMVN